MRFFNKQGRKMMYKTYVTVFFGSTLYLTNLCAATPPETIQLKKFQSLTANNDIQLGAGYFSGGSYPLHNRCIIDMPIKATNFQSSLAMAYSTDIDQLSKNLNVHVTTETGWGKFSSNAAADYIKSIQDDDYSINFNYQNIITVDTSLATNDYYGESVLNKGGALAYSSGADNFIARCGDQYIQNLKMGAVLNITLRIRFENQLEKKNFDAMMKGKLGNIFNASAKISEAVSQKGIQGTIDIIAFQTGGQPNKLSQIFGADNNHHITSCSLSQLDECTKSIDDIIAYAQATGAWSDSGFAKQIQVINGELIADSLSPVAVADATSGSYENDFGLAVQSKQPTQDTIDARKKLNVLYRDMETKLQFAESVMSSAAFKYLGYAAQDKIRNTAKIIKGNLNIFKYKNAMNCFLPGTQDSCVEITKNIEQEMRSVDSATLYLLKDAYYLIISRNWPVIYSPNSAGSMDIYNIGLAADDGGAITHNLKLTPSTDYSYISLSGGYSTYSNGIQTRYYMDSYGMEDVVYFNHSTNTYKGTPPWNTCVGGKCSKVYYDMDILPF